MRRWHAFALVICAGATGTIFWQSRELARAEVATQVGPAPVTPDVTNHPPPAELAELREQNRDLARLRNEARQLRAQKTELDSLRAENAKLVQAKQTGTKVAKPEPPAGFVSKEKLANMGYATPEDAVQTFFWAVRDGNFDAMVASLSPASKERQRFEQMSPEQRTKLAEKLTSAKSRAEFADQLTDIGARGKEVVSEDSIVLHVGSSLSTNTVKISLDRTAEGWKLREPGF